MTTLPGDVLGQVSDDFVDDLMLNWIIEEAMRRLTPEHRVALVETYLRGRPYAQVAAELGVPVGTVRSRVFYGLKALQRVRGCDEARRLGLRAGGVG